MVEERSNITVLENKRAPQAICPKCKDIMYLDMELFKHDVSKIVESKCPKCGVTLYTGLMILVDSDLRHMTDIIMHTASYIEESRRRLL